jgi:predicted SAM-dependent methyltransferase
VDIISETDKVREYVKKYCVGVTLDIGCGLRKITPEAIGIDFSNQYNEEGHPLALDFGEGWEKFFETHLGIQYDCIYSSHLLEDYTNWIGVLLEWTSHIKVGGYLILYLPIEDVYKAFIGGIGYNTHHVNNWKNALHFLSMFPEDLITMYDIVDYSKGVIYDFSFYVVLRKNR